MYKMAIQRFIEIENSRYFENERNHRCSMLLLAGRVVFKKTFEKVHIYFWNII